MAYQCEKREKARQRKQKFFYRPEPCSNGHWSMRYVSSGQCVRCAQAKDNPHGRKMYHVKRTYNLDDDEYYAILKAQDNKCACCGEPFQKTPHIDHCKKSGDVRGFLCQKCNTGLGLLGDDLEGLRKAIKYLQNGLVDYKTYK